MKKLLLAALAVLCGAQMASGAADQVRDGADFNNPNCVRVFVRRTVDSTGTYAGRRDSATIQCAPQVMPTPMTVGGVYATDTTSRVFRTDVNGNMIVNETDKEWEQGTIVSLGISSLSLATAATSGNASGFFADLSPYNHATLMLTWDPADSSNIALGVTLYNKETALWAAYDTPVLLPWRQQGTNPVAAADTTGALAFFVGNGSLMRPTYYVARNATTPVAGTFTLTALSRTPIIVPAAAGVAINLDEVCGSWSYLGLLLTNCNANTVDQIKAVLWVSR